ncbi:MAG: alginate export family protein [Candidatus Omnitrophota bacterium]
MLRKLFLLFFLMVTAVPAYPVGSLKLPDDFGEITFYGRNRARYEAWDYFSSTTDNDYEFGANQLRLGARWDHAYFKGHAAWQYTQLSNLPTRTSAGAGTGSLYYSNSLNRNSHGQYVKYLHVDLKDVWKIGLTGSAGRFNYTSGNEMKSDDKKLDWLKSQRIVDRLIGGFDWSHYGRSFDGTKGVWSNDAVQVEVAGFSPTQGGFEERAHRHISDIDVLAVEANIKKDKLIPGMEENFFYYGYDDHRNIAATTVRFDNTGRSIRSGTETDIELHTFGGHLVGAYKIGPGVWDVLGWAAVQEGLWFELDHEAYAFAAETGYQFNGLPWKPWLRGGFNFASGDDDPKDGDHETFFQMLPTARLYSFSILYNLMNSEDVFLSLILKPLDNVTVRTEVHAVELAEKKDRWYLASGAMHNNVADDFAARASGNNDDLGQLVDVTVSWAVHPDVTITAYYGHFFGGDVAESFFSGNGAQQDANYAYAEVVVNF